MAGKSRAARNAAWVAAIAVATSVFAAPAGLVALQTTDPAASGLPVAAIAQPVRATRIHFEAAETVALYTGTIRPRQEASLGFRLAGKIISRNVEVGDRVSRGQVIARLDDTDALLERDVAAAEDEAARIDLQRAEADVDRSRALFTAGHVAQAALDRATSGQAEAAARSDRAARALQLARNRLSYTSLVADADGIVTATPAETQQVVAAGQPVVSLARAGTVDVVFSLPEQDRAQVATADARAELWDAGGKTYELALRDISPDVDPAGRTYRVRMSVLAPDEDAALGRTVTLSLSTGSEAPAASVPLPSVLNDGTGTAVWRLTPGGDAVERVPVDLVGVSGQVARVGGALREDDLVVSLGAHKIDPTRPVRVVETHTSPES